MKQTSIINTGKKFKKKPKHAKYLVILLCKYLPFVVSKVSMPFDFTLLLQGSRAHTGSKVDVEDGNGATRVGDPSYETRK